MTPSATAIYENMILEALQGMATSLEWIKYILLAFLLITVGWGLGQIAYIAFLLYS